MGFLTWIRSAVGPVLTGKRAALAAGGILLAAIAIGCGGGGGGGSTGFGSRSYVFTNGGQVFTMTVDPDGRFTVFAKDPTAIPTGTGAQGVIDSATGNFTVQGDDATVQFTGTVPHDASPVTGTVRKNSTTLMLFTGATQAANGTTPAGEVGTFYGTSGTNAAYLTVDTTGHGTLYVNANGTTGGGLVNVGAGGALTSTDGSTAGTITVNGSNYDLHITKLNNATVNFTVTVSRNTRAKWTFMVFLNGANDLQEFGPLNFNQMEKVGSTADVNMVVQWKQAACSTCGSPTWVGTRRYLVKKDNDTNSISSTLVQDMGGGVDMGDWRTLKSFVSWAQQNYPADHYALVIWNHGAGWRNTRSADNRLKKSPRSVSLDDEMHTEIEVWDLPQGLAVTPKLDLLVFDASLMQMTEVAYELRNSATYIVGSEESPPGEGYVYDSFLADLVANPNMTPQALGKDIVDRTIQDYPTTSNITQSEIDTSKMQGVADALNTFGNSLLAHIADSKTAMQNARNTAENYAYPENKDLWDYADIIKAGTSASDLKTAATNVQSAIAAATLDNQHSTSHPKSHGLAIYVPDPSAYLSTYANLALSRATSWPQWLQNQP